MVKIGVKQDIVECRFESIDRVLPPPWIKSAALSDIVDLDGISFGDLKSCDLRAVISVLYI